MKRIISSILALILLCVRVFAAAPPMKDGVVFSGTTACGKKIALTFDDGPHPRKTPEILDILDKYGVKATFFVVGTNAEYYPHLIKEEAERGHEIANHSYSHSRLSEFSAERIKEEIERTDAIIKKASGITPTLFRPPEGKYSENIVKAAAEMGKSTVIWTVDTLDWAKTPASVIAENIKNNVTYGSIILFHDFTSKQAHTTEALEIIIPYLKSQGYEFVTVSELIKGLGQ